MSNENITDDTVNTGAPAGAVESEESFADLFEKSIATSERLSPGQKVKSRVISVSGDHVYIDLGGKSDGMIALSEFVGDDGVPRVKPGDEIEAIFLSVEDGMKKLTTLVRGYSSVKLNAVREAFDAGIAVNGEVKQEIKGGFEVWVNGIKCFCPFSQMDLRTGREGGTYVGNTFPFKVLEYKNEGRTVVISRRVLLEEERQEKLVKLKETLEAGKELAVKVRSLQSFGAFVDIGGIDGLIPVSEISWGRIDNPADVLTPGQEVTAKVISIDWAANRFTLSLKAMYPDPWTSVAEKYKTGARVKGTIVRLVPFGAFVNLETGIDGLVHISNLGAGRRINHPKEVVEVGKEVEAYILAVDPQTRKISLSLQPKQEPRKVTLPAVGSIFEGVVDKVMPFGIFLKGENMTGLIPNSEMGTESGTDHSRMFPAGATLQTVVLEADSVKGKVLLSRKGVMEKAEQEQLRKYRDSLKSEEASGVGSLGEMLKAKMEEKNISF
jgi:small subunit ribosomal protein S1